ncbi:MAG: hypothetical protein COW73_03595 [Nitrospirae bacterium CG18_big_fil_WC_8_21_14_2_50_70_55]|nr:peptidoglycan-binding protein [Deltaproteobacteria bacterium]OIP66749.1 MAG: hypothetical protein AUK30_01665 [Nitrospirae bacterium CG2_30_70_394]PIQ06384.1 MAG: hypothetical protein COW73_03595 [Nitrospirae bacterium CG18_big_fil_WC_8_21_14_2_50_70_55]PIU77322.1 MAG: hypothetical protein COS73_11010 [Nitrospirae bacterium CG06_land_8_20_14_3_00_70_43]PIW83879.1 MAG: hypothetical protein COZ96_00900 [Nitrospirae bacterium CG_4_8_14_3_um_filter_70_85]PIX82790.1 MAG: hypothetical protein COZ
MPINHRVREGETVASIAAPHGLAPETVWDDPANAQLKAQRGDPNILAPGDVVVVPDKRAKEESGATEQRHRFRTHRSTVTLRLVLHDAGNKPVANAACTLVVGERSFDLTSDGDGQIEQRVPAGEQDGKLLVGEQLLPMKIGHLDPLDVHAGQRERLNNLGYRAGQGDDPDAPAYRSAVEEFQCDYDLGVNGVCGLETQNKLKEVHGC